MRLVSALALGLSLSLPTLALPGDPTPIHGQIQIQNLSPNLVQILQSTPQAIINWSTFNIGSGETVRFLQPSAQAAVLNRVTGLDPSTIQGQLQANGRVFLLNPNGILFGPNAVVDVGSFTASTLKMSDEDFLSGNYRLTQDPNLPLAALTNQGQIRVAEGGFVVLVSPLLDNQGMIVAQAGTVQLGASTRATFSVDGRGQVAFVVPDGFDPTFSGGGKGGTVLLQGGQMSQLLSQVASNPNLVEAAHFQELASGQTLMAGGEGILLNSGSIQADTIRLDSSQATVHAAPGQLQGQDVRVLSAGSTVSQGSIASGFAEVSGHKLWLTGPVVADTLLLDPDFIEITDTAPGTYDPILGTGLPSTGSGTVSTSAITSATNLILNANFDITYDGIGFSGSNTNLQLIAGRDISLQSSGAISLASLRLQATRDVILTGNPNMDILTSGNLEVLASNGDVRIGGNEVRLISDGTLDIQGVNIRSNTTGRTELTGVGNTHLRATTGDIDIQTFAIQIGSTGASAVIEAGNDIRMSASGFGLLGMGSGGQLTVDAVRDLVLSSPTPSSTVNLNASQAHLVAGRNITYTGEQISNPGDLHMSTTTGNISLLSQPGSHATIYANNVLNITSGNDFIGRTDDRIEIINGSTTTDYLKLSAAGNIDLRANGGHVDIVNFGGSTSVSAQNVTSQASGNSVWGSRGTLSVQSTTGDVVFDVTGGTQEFFFPSQVSAARDLTINAPLIGGASTSLQANRNLSVRDLTIPAAGNLSLSGGNLSLESMDRVSGGNYTFTTAGNLTERTPSSNPPNLAGLTISAGRIFSPGNTANNVSFAIPNTGLTSVAVTGSNDSALGAAASLRNFNGANVQPQVGPTTGAVYVDGVLYSGTPNPSAPPAPPVPPPVPPSSSSDPIVAQSQQAALSPEERSQIAVQSNLSLGNLGGLSRVLSEGERERLTARADALHSSWNTDPFSPTLSLALPGGSPPVYSGELAELAALLNQSVGEEEKERVRAGYNALVDQELREIWEVRYWRHLLERFVIWEDRE
ncbi:MAG: filamentous hemagglutinin N-terminal domain-containing protein [Candidatus Eremiobacteraeota bacterium]|nr:filamentous hemagglutinin N-terminal domain-containing protein [Candidatus Eremiobacteraeota bacterium]